MLIGKHPKLVFSDLQPFPYNAAYNWNHLQPSNLIKIHKRANLHSCVHFESGPYYLWIWDPPCRWCHSLTFEFSRFSPLRSDINTWACNKQGFQQKQQCKQAIVFLRQWSTPRQSFNMCHPWTAETWLIKVHADSLMVLFQTWQYIQVSKWGAQTTCVLGTLVKLLDNTTVRQ